MLTFGVRDGKLIRTWRPRINLSLHAMGRWFEHTGKREHELLLADLTRLAEAPETAGDKVYCPPRGIWLGAVTVARQLIIGKRPSWQQPPATDPGVSPAAVCADSRIRLLHRKTPVKSMALV